MLTVPRLWASNPNYASGPDSGTPTKVDPASDANGFVRGVIAAPQHVNFLLNQYSAIASYMLHAHLVAFEDIVPDAAVTASGPMGVVYNPNTQQVLQVSGNESREITDDGLSHVRGTIGTLTGASAVAVDPATNTYVAVGSGGNNAARSTNRGSSWTDAGSGPLGLNNVVWDATNGLFIGADANGLGTVSTSPTGATWASRSLGVNNSTKLGTASSGISLIGSGSGASTIFIRSTNGTTWANSGTSLPSIASATGNPAVCAIGATIYAACNYGSTTVKVFSTTDGINWGQVGSDLTVPSGGITQLLGDEFSGALYLQYTTSLGSTLYASVDGGLTWFGPGLPLGSNSFLNLWPAAGRLYLGSNNAAIFRRSSLRLPEA